MFTFKAKVVDSISDKVLGYVIEFPCGLLFIEKCEMGLFYKRSFTNGKVTSCGSVILTENIKIIRRKGKYGIKKKQKDDFND